MTDPARRPRVGVYNRYWSTAGGAEKVAGAAAEALSRDCDVELLGPDRVDRGGLGERLQVDLSRTSSRVLRDRPGAVTRASRDYDLFVNASFLNHDPTEAGRGIYYVHFPGRPDADLNWGHRLAIRLIGPLVRTRWIGWGEGFYPPEGGRPRHFWTSGRASFFLDAPTEVDLSVRLLFARQRLADLPPTTVTVAVDGVPAAEVVLEAGGSLLARRRGVPVVVVVPARPDGAEVEITISSETFTPADVGGGDDDRRLGVALTAIHSGTGLIDRIAGRLGAWFPVLYRSLAASSFADSYDVILANSAFTQTWVERYWGVESQVLHPPVTMQASAAKESVILSVGRFFAARAGHSKKQLEMVRAFARLVERGLSGWTLHLVGGCSPADRAYLEEVRAAAEGLAVEIHVDASGEALARLYGAASLYWHATGLGEDGEAHPDRQEHFGIAVVEAMSAAAVPFVVGRAGPAEVVRPGADGYHFQTIDELVTLTEAMIADPAARERVGAAAALRAQDFSAAAFAARLRDLSRIV